MGRATSELLQILEDIVHKLNQPDCDVSWSPYHNQAEASADIERHIASLKQGGITDFQDLKVLFAPTGALQEISISSGWGEEFLALATRFDAAVEDSS